MVYRFIYWACAHQYSIVFVTLCNNNDCFCIIVRGRFRVGVGVDVKKTKLNVLLASGFSLYPSESQSSRKTADLLELDCPVTDGAEAGPAGDWDSGPALYVQLHGEAARRLGPEERPLQLQNDFLFKLGFKDPWRVQEEGMNTELGSLLRFYAGKPCSIESSERIQLSGTYNVRKGKLQLPVNRWSRRQVILCGTCLMVSSVKASHTGKMHILPLIGGKVMNSHVIILWGMFVPNQTFFQIFGVVSQRISSVDLSCCSLEKLPSNLLYSQDLTHLNLKHNFLPADQTLLQLQRSVSEGFLSDCVRLEKSNDVPSYLQRFHQTIKSLH
uniref:PHLPP-like RA domain-containing protein n=1 Tax=Sinocyclocheilus rhinocerous TaxID=307959 RepID=A0A673JB88_9TELE